MNVAPIAAPEGRLLNLLHEISPLAWRRFNQRYLKSWIRGEFRVVDRSVFPPGVYFRFENEDERVVKNLKNSIESYSGKISWVLSGRQRDSLPGVNWAIYPKRIDEVKKVSANIGISPREYVAIFEPVISIDAYNDIESLESHIRRNFLLK
jgi:hypothetical protein